MKPIIGMPWMEGQELFRKYMLSKYVNCLKRAGAQVRWISLEDPEKAAAEVLECDGLLMPGGNDISPRYYGQEPTEKCGKTNAVQDAGEMALLKAFLPTRKPILCICRGHQLLNVFFGGTLHQDIQGFQKVRHSHFPSKNRGIHRVKLTPHTKLSLLFQEESVLVNSIHHQAADRIGDGLQVAAVSEDGIVEALEHRFHPFCVGVQWHPEHMRKNRKAHQKLFDLFVTVCSVLP